MKTAHFVTDMAVEVADSPNYAHLSSVKNLSYDIVLRMLKIKSLEDAKRIGRDRGVYVTYDCSGKIFESDRAVAYLEKLIADTLKQMIGTIKKSSPVLVVGLGNEDVVADSLGKRVVSNVKVVLDGTNVSAQTQRVCAISTGVATTTGINTIDFVKGVADTIKPSVVLLVDSLATTSVSRLGVSYQISTAGISPGSGVYQDKERIDKSVLRVPTISIGVPLMLSMSSALYSFVKDYTSQIGCRNDEFRLRQMLAEKKMSSLVVAPKEIDFYVEMASLVIANAINKAFA